MPSSAIEICGSLDWAQAQVCHFQVSRSVFLLPADIQGLVCLAHGDTESAAESEHRHFTYTKVHIYQLISSSQPP